MYGSHSTVLQHVFRFSWTCRTRSSINAWNLKPQSILVDSYHRDLKHEVITPSQNIRNMTNMIILHDKSSPLLIPQCYRFINQMLFINASAHTQAQTQSHTHKYNKCINPITHTQVCAHTRACGVDGHGLQPPRSSSGLQMDGCREVNKDVPFSRLLPPPPRRPVATKL